MAIRRRARGAGRGGPRRRIGVAVSARFRAIDRRLHINHRGRSEWIWAVPIIGFLVTFGLFVVQGAVVSGVTPLLYVPIGLIVAGVIGGMSVAYMTPEPDHGGSDDGGSERRDPPPDPPRDGWAGWLRTPPDRLPDEPEPALKERPREPAGAAGPH
jgi:hypothetical protein